MKTSLVNLLWRPALLGGALLLGACGGAPQEEVSATSQAPAAASQQSGLSCGWYTQGSTSSCKDLYAWKGYASQDCQSRGQQITSYTLLESCGTGVYRYVNYQCC